MHNDTAKSLIEESEPQALEALKEISVPAPERLKTMDSPRLIKTHLPLSLLPKGVDTNTNKVLIQSNKIQSRKEGTTIKLLYYGFQIIYVARNPKDVLPSYYFLLRLWKTTDYKASFLQFWKQFKNGQGMQQVPFCLQILLTFFSCSLRLIECTFKIFLFLVLITMKNVNNNV